MTGTGPLIRPMTPADRPALANFPNRVSAGSAIFRFHGSVTVLTDKTLDLLLDLVDGQREAITAVDDRGIAGVARFARDDLDPATAEVAILVADEWQHRGLASAPPASRGEGSKRGNRTVSRRDSGGQHRRAALLPPIDTDRARAAQQRRRGRAHQRSGTTSHAGLTFARAQVGRAERQSWPRLPASVDQSVLHACPERERWPRPGLVMAVRWVSAARRGGDRRRARPGQPPGSRFPARSGAHGRARRPRRSPRS